MVFWAYVAVPIALFWFLDYVSALRDTSLFAALIVAFGYRQIFAGGIAGISLPGQTQQLWNPFETWAKKVAERIVTRSKRDRDRFDDQVRTYLASDSQRLQGLLMLALFYTKNQQTLETQLENLKKEVAPAGVSADAFTEMQSRKQARILLLDLRKAEPENYGYFLYKKELIAGWQYHVWLEDVKSTRLIWGMRAVFVVMVGAGFYFFFHSAPMQILYHQWRFAKPNVSEKDRFRSYVYLGQSLENVKHDDNLLSKQAEAVISPLVDQLGFKEVSPRLKDDMLRLVINFHSLPVNAVVIPHLIDTLWTENADVRLRVHQTLQKIQKADYPNVTVAKTTEAWIPAKDELPGDIDLHVHAWHVWWDSVRQTRAESPEPIAQPPPH